MLIVALLLENGADVNSKNYCGQVKESGYFHSAVLRNYGYYEILINL